MANNEGQTVNNQVARTDGQQVATIDPVAEAFRLKLQNFSQLLNMTPPLAAIDATPDGKAKTVLISHIEMQLDQLFFGLWETYDFKWSVIANEVVGSLILEVVHPVNGQKVKRQGAASIVIMVNKAPENISQAEKTLWANNPDNKKSNALDMGFPKLKAECLKNAAQSLGKVFGRDLNRVKSTEYKGIQKDKGKAKAQADAAAQAAEDLLK